MTEHIIEDCSKKSLLDYAGFIKADKIDPEAENAAIEDAAVARFMGE